MSRLYDFQASFLSGVLNLVKKYRSDAWNKSVILNHHVSAAVVADLLFVELPFDLVCRGEIWIVCEPHLVAEFVKINDSHNWFFVLLCSCDVGTEYILLGFNCFCYLW